MSTERNYVGEITLEYSTDENPHVCLEIDEAGSTLLSMDQVDSLASILRGWVEKYRQAERDGWERRAKQRGER